MRLGLGLLGRTSQRIARARGGLFGMAQTLVAQGVTLFVNVATGIITARLLGPAGRGEFASAGLWILLPSLLSVVGLQSAAVYEIRRQPTAAASISVAAFGLATAAYIPIALVSLWLIPSLMHGYRSQIVCLARLAVLGSVLNVWSLIQSQVLLGTRNMHVFNLSTYSMAMVYLMLLLVLVAFHALSPTTGILAMIAGTTLVLVPKIGWVARQWCWRSLRPFAFVGPLVRYTAKAAATDMVGVLYSHIDRLVLIGLVSPAAFGLYAVAISFARTLMVLQSAVSSVTLADLSHKPVAEIEVYIHRTFRALLWLLLVVCMAGVMLGGPLLRLLYGQHFGDAAPIFYVLLADASLTCLGQLLIEAFLASGKPLYPSAVQVVCLGITTAALFILTPRLGGIGAGTAMACGSSLRLFLLLMGLRRIGLGLPNPIPRPSEVRDLLVVLRTPDEVSRPTSSRA